MSNRVDNAILHSTDVRINNRWKSTRETIKCSANWKGEFLLVAIFFKEGLLSATILSSIILDLLLIGNVLSSIHSSFDYNNNNVSVLSPTCPPTSFPLLLFTLLFLPSQSLLSISFYSLCLPPYGRHFSPVNASGLLLKKPWWSHSVISFQKATCPVRVCATSLNIRSELPGPVRSSTACRPGILTFWPTLSCFPKAPNSPVF